MVFRWEADQSNFGNEVEADIIGAEPLAGKDKLFMENLKAHRANLFQD